MDLDTLSQALSRELSNIETDSSSVYDEDIDEASKFFRGELPGIIDKDIDEFFQVITTQDVANTVEHSLADIMPAFSSDQLVFFPPDSEADVARAHYETLAVNKIILQDCEGFIKLTEACKNGLMYRRAVLEVRAEERFQVSYATLDGLSVAELIAGKYDVVSIDGVQLDDIEIDLDPTTVVEAEIRNTYKERVLIFEAVPVDEFKVNSDHASIDLDTARFVARDYPVSASDLIQLGIDQQIVDELPEYSTSDSRPYRSKSTVYNMTETGDPSTKLVRVVRAYYRIDMDGDGIAELRYILAAGNDDALVILENRPWDVQPFILGVPLIDQHLTQGISLVDKIKQVQVIKTKVLRQILMAGERSIRGRIGVVGSQANKDDVYDSAFGGVVRLTTPNGVVPIPGERFPQESFSLLDYQDKERRESGGASVDKAGTEQIPVGLDIGAHGMERLMSAMEQLNSYIAKTLAESLVKKAFVKVHHNLRKYWLDPINVQAGDVWITATPAQWPMRTQSKTSIGLTQGDRLRYVGLLSQMIAEAQQLRKDGSLLVQEQNLYAMLEQRSIYANIPNYQSFYLNPSSPEGRQVANQAQRQQQEAAQLQLEQTRRQQQLLLALEEVRANSRIQAQQIKTFGDLAEGEAKNTADLEKELSKLKLEYNKLSVKMVELNAKYDEENVPDLIPNSEVQRATDDGSETVQ